MRIQNQTNYNCRKPQNFTSNLRSLHDETGKLIYRNTTSFFRDDLNWNKFADLLIKKYDKVNKVNVHCFACSEGAEPYSLAMILIEKLGKENAQKFFPIIASDIDAEIIKNAQSGIINVSERDMENFYNTLGTDLTKYKYLKHGEKFKKDQFLNEAVAAGEIRPILKDTVIFKQADIRETFREIPKENSVVMCRNFWHYIPKEDRENLSSDLSEHLGKDSMVILGEFDGFTTDVLERFGDRGYEDPCVEFCFSKKEENKNQLANPKFWLNTLIRKKK